MKEARYWEKKEEGKTRCLLCPRLCMIKEGKTGLCGNKLNQGGVLYASRYGEVSALAMDPIEKKPLYHYHPGSSILSVGTVGCNFSCDFCQNYHLWDGKVRTDGADPKDIVAAAERQGSGSIAYTYNEPYVNFEFVIDAARLSREKGIGAVLVTNGYYNPEPLEEILPYIDAMNVDLKSIRDGFYRRLCGGGVKPVMKTIERAAGDCLVEVTNLIVTGENDSDEDIAELVDFIHSVSPDLPLHFSAYRPMYKMKNPATPAKTMLRAYEIAKARLNYVYLGNVVLEEGSDSICPNCGAVLVSRSGYRTKIGSLSGDSCSSCKNKVNFVN